MIKRIDDKNLPAKGQRGAVIIIFALCLFVLIGFAALAIDIGYLNTTRSELQNVADAAALAGARYLGAKYVNLDPTEMATHTFTKEEVHAVIEAVALQNKAANKSIFIDIADVEIGFWDVEKSADDIWYPTLVGPDAVRVIARRDGSANGPISTFLARIFNINTMNVASEKAIAALSGPSFVGKGELNTPFGLSENVFPNDCTDVIAFSPTTDSCAGWHNFFDSINAAAMEDKLLGFIQGDTNCEHCGSGLLNGPDWIEANFDLNNPPSSEETPSTSAGDEFNFQGGTISSLFLGGYLGSDYDGNTGTVYDNEKKPAPMIALFDYFRFRDGDGNDSVWTAVVPVYKDSESGCINPNNAIEIVGFAEIVIFSPDPPPLSNIQVHVNCNFSVIEARGGGGSYGNLRGTIPTLVK
jgi:hypothetical protein